MAIVDLGLVIQGAFKMVVTNVRILTNTFNELYTFDEDAKHAVMGITESWLNDDYSGAEFIIPGYVTHLR